MSISGRIVAVGALAANTLAAMNGLAQNNGSIPTRTGNEKGSRRAVRHTQAKPSSMNQWGNSMMFHDMKEISRRVNAARDFNRSLDKRTRYNKHGRAITRIIPHPGTLVMGSR